MVILENIDIDKAILQNIDIDKISNRFKFGISNSATGGSVLCFYHFIIIHICSWCLFYQRGIMKLCCPPWRSVQGSAFHNTGSFARFFVHLFCSRCWCSVLAVVGLCACVLVLRAPCLCLWVGRWGGDES